MTHRHRLLRVLPFATSALVALVVADGAASASAASGSLPSPSGTLTFQPASGVAAVPLTAVSTGVCSDPRGTNLQLRVSGAGFPEGTNVTPNLKADIYPIDPSTGGYDVPLQDTLQAFADQQTPPAKLAGRYTFTLVCKKSLGRDVFQSYVGSLVFSSSSQFTALVPTASASLPATPSLSPRVPVTPAPARHSTAATSAARPTVPADVSVTSGPLVSIARPPAKPTLTRGPALKTLTAAPASRAAASSGGQITPLAPPTGTLSPPRSASAVVVPGAPSVAATTPVVTRATASAAALALTASNGPFSQATAILLVVGLAVVSLLGLVLRRRRSRGDTA